MTWSMLSSSPTLQVRSCKFLWAEGRLKILLHGLILRAVLILSSLPIIPFTCLIEEAALELERCQSVAKQWKNLWSVKVPTKMKIILWHDCLATGYQLQRLHISATSDCCFCGLTLFYLLCANLLLLSGKE